MIDSKTWKHSIIIQIALFIPSIIITLNHFLPSNPILGLLSLLVICTFPGYAMLIRFKLQRSSRFQDLFFSVLLSLLLLQAIYATYSVLCFGLGFEHSLAKVPVFIIASILLLFCSILLKNNIDILKSYQIISKIGMRLRKKSLFLYLIPLAIPITSLIAVARLNVLKDSMTTGIFLYSCIGILLFLMSGNILRKSSGMHYLIFYCTLLGLLFGSTFRGDGGFWGWDINWEFPVTSRILLQQHWIPLPDSPYNSMLSITVLPVVLSFLTKFSLTIIFKLFFPLVAALIPVASYSLLRRFVRNSIAMCVVIIQTIGSISYIPQFTALARQTIGIAFFVGIVLVLFDPVWDRKKKAKIILILACGLSFSHYSSAYLCSTIFLGSGVLSLLLRRLDFFRRKDIKPVATLGLGLAILGITLMWNGVFNNSAQDLVPFTQELVTKGPQFLPNKTGSFVDRWLSGVINTSEPTASEFKIGVLQDNSFKYPNFQIHPSSLSYDITPTEDPGIKTFFGTSTQKFFYWLYVIINSAFQGIIVLQVFFSLILVFGLLPNRGRKKIEKYEPRLPNVLVELIPLAIVSFLFALNLRISGTSSGVYNPERAGFQLAFIFSLSIALLLEMFRSLKKSPRRFWATGLLISSFVFLQQSTGLIGYIYGTPSSRISSSIDIDMSFVISENERKAAEWLYKYKPKNSLLQGDTYSNLVKSHNDIFYTQPYIAQTAPFGLFVGSYIYFSKSNIESGISRQRAGRAISFRAPFDYLDQNLSVVYSSGGARVYR
jgi:uncharacterized membrane protein